MPSRPPSQRPRSGRRKERARPGSEQTVEQLRKLDQAELVEHCEQVRAGPMPDEVLRRILDDMFWRGPGRRRPRRPPK